MRKWPGQACFKRKHLVWVQGYNMVEGNTKLFWHVSPYGNYQEYSTRCENLKTRNLKTSRSQVSNAGEPSFNRPWSRPSYPTHGVLRMGLDEDEVSENRVGFQGWGWDGRDRDKR